MPNNAHRCILLWSHRVDKSSSLFFSPFSSAFFAPRYHVYSSKYQQRTKTISTHNLQNYTQDANNWLNNLIHSSVFEDGKQEVGNAVSVLWETLRGIDELTMKAHVDKMNILCYSNLKNADQIAKMSISDIKSLLELSKVPVNPQDLTTEEMQKACVNLMLGLLEKMSTRELQEHLNAVQWNTMAFKRDQMLQALRLWVQHPQCQLFKSSRFHGRLTAAHLRNQESLSDLKFYCHEEINSMSIERLSQVLSQRNQSVDTGGAYTSPADLQVSTNLPSKSMQSNINPPSIPPELFVLQNRLKAFQEFVVLRLFGQQDCREFLRKRFWTRQINNMAISQMRIRCLKYIHVPNIKKYYLHQIGKNLSPSSYNEQALAARREWATKEDDILEKCLDHSRSVYSYIIKNGSFIELSDDVDIYDEKMKFTDYHIPKSVSIDRENILNYAPRVAFDGETKLWSLSDELAWKSQKPDLWIIVSNMAYVYYGMKRSPEQCKKRWLALQNQRTLSENISAYTDEKRSIKDENNEDRIQNPKANFPKNVSINKISSKELDVDLNKLLVPVTYFKKQNDDVLRDYLNTIRQDTEGTRANLQERIWNFHQYQVLNNLSQDTLAQFLHGNFWKTCNMQRSRFSEILNFDTLKIRALMCLRNPLYGEFLNFRTRKLMPADVETVRVLLEESLIEVKRRYAQYSLLFNNDKNQPELHKYVMRYFERDEYENSGVFQNNPSHVQSGIQITIDSLKKEGSSSLQKLLKDNVMSYDGSTALWQIRFQEVLENPKTNPWRLIAAILNQNYGITLSPFSCYQLLVKNIVPLPKQYSRSLAGSSIKELEHNVEEPTELKVQEPLDFKMDIRSENLPIYSIPELKSMDRAQLFDTLNQYQEEVNHSDLSNTEVIYRIVKYQDQLIINQLSDVKVREKLDQVKWKEGVFKSSKFAYLVWTRHPHIQFMLKVPSLDPELSLKGGISLNQTKKLVESYKNAVSYFSKLDDSHKNSIPQLSESLSALVGEGISEQQKSHVPQYDNVDMKFPQYWSDKDEKIFSSSKLDFWSVLHVYAMEEGLYRSKMSLKRHFERYKPSKILRRRLRKLRPERKRHFIQKDRIKIRSYRDLSVFRKEPASAQIRGDSFDWSRLND